MVHDDVETGKRSVFNAAISMMERLDSLQRAINSARFNPIAFNPEVGKFNYEIMVSSCDGLMSECWCKLTPDEMKKGDRIRTIISDFLRTHPIIYNVQGEMKLNNTNLIKFNKMFILYEQICKVFLDNHNLGTPDFVSDEGL